VVEAILKDYIDNQNLIILYFLRDTTSTSGFGPAATRKCSLTEEEEESSWPIYVSWGDEGDTDFPLMVSVVLNHDEGDPDQNTEIVNWFNLSSLNESTGESPWFILLDENFYVVSETQDKYQLENLLDSMLDN